jgi:hypothetical protein
MAPQLRFPARMLKNAKTREASSLPVAEILQDEKVRSFSVSIGE